MFLDLKVNNKSYLDSTEGYAAEEIEEWLANFSNISLENKNVQVDITGEIDMDGNSARTGGGAQVSIKILDGDQVLFERKDSLVNFLKTIGVDKLTIVKERSIGKQLLKPKVEGEFQVKRGDPSSSNRFRMKELKQDEFSLISLPDLGLRLTPKEQEVRLKVLVERHAYHRFITEKWYSDYYEEGGFLIGKVFNDMANRDSHVIKITDVIDAEHIGASAVRLIFTGESFSIIKKLLRTEEMKGKRILGWYHTHLFPAGTGDMELSKPDLKLHFTTFRFPWQVAGLINVELDKSNKLRFYTKKTDELSMEQMPFWII